MNNDKTLDKMSYDKTLDNASNAVGDSISAKYWSSIETNLDESSLSVIESLGKCVEVIIQKSGDMYVTTKRVKHVMTDEYYIKNRETFIKHGLVNKDTKLKITKETTEKKKNKKKGLNADGIRAMNTEKNIKKSVDEIIKTYDMNNLTFQTGFRSQYIEMIGMTMIYIGKFMVKNLEKYKKKKYFHQVLSIMVSMQRFINSCSSYQGKDPVLPDKKSNISQIFINDMQESYEFVNSVFPFDGLLICREYPELLVSSVFDQYIQETAICPRDHQVQLIRAVHDNFHNGFFGIYKAMIGSGKTTSIIPYAKLAMHFKKKVLCVCNIDPVRMQMANLCFNATIRFAIGTIRYGNLKITYHDNSNFDNYTVIICDPMTAHRILTEDTPLINKNYGPVSKRGELFMMFHDEPTIGADKRGSKPLRDNVHIMINPCKWTVFSSATSPTEIELEPVINRIKERYPELSVHTICSTSVHISCEVRTYDGEFVVPYMGKGSSREIKQVIQRCSEVPFLGRMLSPVVAINLYELLKNNNISVPDIKELFKNVDNMKADKIRKIVLDMLETLSQQSDKVINKVCSSKLVENVNNKNKNKNKEEEDFGFEWEGDNDIKNPKEINLDKLGQGEIWNGMTLIACTDTVKFALTSFKDLLKDIKKTGYKSSAAANADFRDELTKWETNKNKILKNLEISDIEKAKKEAEFDLTRPKYKFPEFAQIGTVEYVKKYIKNKSYVIDTRDYIDPESILEYKSRGEKKTTDLSSVPDDFITLLHSGIGVYDPNNSVFNTHYTDLVLDFASKGKLAYVVSNISMAYGTNFPFGASFITDDFTKIYSVNTLFQLMGRAGRVNKFYKACAYISPDAGRMIIDYTTNPEKYNTEIKNIIEMIDILDKEKQDNQNAQQLAIANELKRLEDELLRELNL